jgi:hypothetical protein
MFQKSSNILGIDVTLWRSSKQNTLLGVHSWKPDRKEICNREHSGSIAFLWMWQELHWWNRHTSSSAAPWTYAQSQWGSSRKIKVSSTGSWIGWDENESNSKCKKYKESAHMTFLSNPIKFPPPLLSWFQLCACFVTIFIAHFSCCLPLTRPALRYLYSSSYTDIVLSERSKRVGVSIFTWRWK